MSNSRKLIIEVIGDTSKLDRSFRGVETRSQKLGASFKRFGKAGAIGAGIAGTALLTKQLKASVSAAFEAEKAQVRLEGAFKSAGASRLQLAAATAKIAEVSRQAAIDDEELSDSLAKLTRTTGSAQKGLKGMALAANIARARGISLGAATKIVEKAFIGQLRGLKAVGVEIDKNTTSTEAIDRAQRKFAGSAEAYGKTASAAQERLGVAFENLQEKIGAKLIPILTKLALALIDVIDFTEKNWPKFSKAIQNAARVIRPIVERMLEQFRAIAKVVQGVVNIVDGIVHGQWGQVWRGMKQVVIDGVGGMIKAILTLPARILKALGREAWQGLKRVGGFIGDALVGGIKAAVNAVVKAIQAVINKAIDVVNAAIDKLNKPSAILNKLTPGSVAPTIPKIPKFGAEPTTRRRLPGPETSDTKKGGRADRALAVVGGDVVVHTTIKVNEDVLARSVTRNQQITRRRNPPQKRGPNRVGGV